MRRYLPVRPVLFVLLITASASSALAQGTQGVRFDGWGVRVGLSSNPDQAYGGVHFNLGQFAKDVRFRPTVELGFGDNVTLLQGLAEVHYVFSKVQVWKPYVGGGLGLTYANVDADADDDSDTELSLAAIGGIETKLKSGMGFMLELKIGFGDNDPDAKFGVGWTF